MNTKLIDAIAIGTCYVDTNAHDYPFGESGIPVETELVGSQYETVPGGSAVNFCLLLQKLGLKTAFIGMAGSDPNGDSLSLLLQENGVRPALIRRPDLHTNVSFNMTNPQGAHIMLVAGTANAALNPEAVIPKLEEVIVDAKMLYLGGCFKLKAFASAFGQIADLAKKHETDVIVDHSRIPEGTDEEMLAAVKQLVLSATYYFPSRDEFCQLWKVGGIEDGLRMLHEQTPNLTVVVKDGQNGAYYWANDSVKHVEAIKVEKVVNATGAGDSFNAGVMVAIVQGRSTADAVSYGCSVAAAKISGKAMPGPSEI